MQKNVILHSRVVSSRHVFGAGTYAVTHVFAGTRSVYLNRFVLSLNNTSLVSLIHTQKCLMNFLLLLYTKSEFQLNFSHVSNFPFNLKYVLTMTKLPS